MIDPKLLRDIQFFADLSDDELKVIAKIIRKKEFKTGDTVFKESEDGQSIYVIKSGEVKACKTAPDGELFTLTLMKDGDIFGEMSFLDGRPRSATIVAISDLETYMIDKKDFETIVDQHPRIIYKLLRNIVFTIHSIVRGMNSRYIEMLNYMWGRKRFT
ncbi:MAG: cyclic nucleotide-binding domain-containing protein [Deltaproteobacteria bacterium]|nr:cyclic nucleotide-binding domain-containing protein [Deltaproteobacteria bacterium]MBI5810023.1 cyclic nucleotide-binding domain-containing protein [Deltaproteobacteria bacterium]